MHFQVLKSTALIILALLLFLVGCAQSPTYAPVKTVNQALKPVNGYDSNKTPQNTVDTQKSPQKTTNILSPAQTNQLDRQKTVTTNKPASGNDQKQGLVQSTPSISKPGNSPKNKSHNPVVDNKVASKQQKLPLPKLVEIKQPKNKPTISNIKTVAGPKKSQENTKISDKQVLNPKKIKEKTSIVSIDNKKMLKLNFGWPMLGKVARNFAQTDNKGIDIIGKTGQTVHAAESGKAVYCGHGLVGFGNLAIIKHNETYLSAYANNSKLYVKEGQQVAKGQAIGQVGSTKLTKTSLHFEIRKNGKAINPLSLLPKH